MPPQTPSRMKKEEYNVITTSLQVLEFYRKTEAREVRLGTTFNIGVSGKKESFEEMINPYILFLFI